jgi:hypothetical protein
LEDIKTDNKSVATQGVLVTGFGVKMTGGGAPPAGARAASIGVTSSEPNATRQATPNILWKTVFMTSLGKADLMVTVKL